MIPSGNHRAKAVKGTYYKSGKKGTPGVRVAFKVIGGEADGQHVNWDGWYTEGTTARTIESLRHCGCTFPGDDITNLAGLDTNEVELVVEHEDFTYEEGERAGETVTRAKVAWVNGAGGIAEEQKMDDKERTIFAAKMKGALVAARARNGSLPNGTKRAPTKPAPGTWDGTGPEPNAAENDIPF
jgi:hypothetical protein